MPNVTRRNLLASAAATALCGSTTAVATPFNRGGRSSSFSIPLTLTNLDRSNSYSAPCVSYGHAFGDGDIPANGSVALTDSQGNPVVAQMDAVSLWPSGCPRFVVISHGCAETFAPAESLTYLIGASSKPPNNRPAREWGHSPERTLIANTNFVVEYSGFDARDSRYTVALNRILRDYPVYPWGIRYPQGGWERTKTGPACMEWHAWQYLINDRTSKPQGYVRCDIWLKAWSPTGPFEIDVRTSQPNLWNAISHDSEMYARNPGRWATLCVVKNGSDIIQYAGGPGDYRTRQIANSRFKVGTCQIAADLGSLFPQQGIVFSSTATLPAGLKPGRLYWLAYNGQPDAYICSERVFASAVERGEASQWQADKSYSSDYGGQYVINGNIVYVCVQSGTSGSGGGPTGTGDAIVDGTCLWENATVPFFDRGSGTITAYPVNACFPSTAWMTSDALGNPLWSGSGARPPIFPGHDFNYLTTQSKFVPCYNINAGSRTTNKRMSAYAPNQNYGGILWYQDTTGDGPDDQRIGYVDNWGVATLYNPTDGFYLYSSVRAALSYNNASFSYMVDERGGLPFAANDGPHKNGTRYRDLPPVQLGFSAGNAPAFGVGNWLPWSTERKDQSGYGGQYYVDTSHTPASWQIPYLKTGRTCFLDQGVHLGNVNCFMQYVNSATLGSTTYYCVPNAGVGIQERAWAWALRSLCQAVYVIPAAHPFEPVLRDYYEDNAALHATYYSQYVPSQARALGLLNVLDAGGSQNGHIGPWEQFFVFLCVAMETWRGGLTGSRSGRHWASVLKYMNNFWNIYGASLPGSMYYIGLYEFVYSPNPQDLETAYQDPLDALTASFNSGYNPGLVAPYPSGGLYDPNNPGGNYFVAGDFPWNCNWYGSIGRAAMKMVTVADPSNTTVATLLQELISYTSAATGISARTAGIQWHGRSSDQIENFQTFAIF
jgi:hypothetical protein